MSIGKHVYADETKAKGYVMVAATLVDREVPSKELRELVLPGQRALHMRDESDSRRRAIVSTLDRLRDHGLTVSILDANRRYKTELHARRACLELIVERMSPDGELVLDRDETLVSWDRGQLVELGRRHVGGIRYRHASRHQELLLAIPDAVAWCWGRGGPWRRRVKALATEVIAV